jgi:hypothetical protein
MSETPRFPLPGDETSLFSEEEYRAAYRLIMREEEAELEARAICTRYPHDAEDNREWQISSDLLDLLSLVSNESAGKVARILALPPDEARKRRERFATRLGLPLP